MVSKNKVGNIAQEDINQKGNVKKIMGGFLRLSSIQILNKFYSSVLNDFEDFI